MEDRSKRSDPDLRRNGAERGRARSSGGAGGFALRGLLMAANHQNDASDRVQVARAQSRLDEAFAGSGCKARLIYEALNRQAPAPARDSSDEEQGGPPRSKRQREPDPVLDEEWAAQRCRCPCGCRAEIDGRGRQCKDCLREGPRHAKLMQNRMAVEAQLGSSSGRASADVGAQAGRGSGSVRRERQRTRSTSRRSSRERSRSRRDRRRGAAGRAGRSRSRSRRGAGSATRG